MEGKYSQTFFPPIGTKGCEMTREASSDNILVYFNVLPWLTPCWLIVFWAVLITPVCWFGSPHDFWFAAPAALLATFIACILIMVRESLDVRDENSCYINHTDNTLNETAFEPTFPDKIEFLGFGEGEGIKAQNIFCFSLKF